MCTYAVVATDKPVYRATAITVTKYSSQFCKNMHEYALTNSFPGPVPLKPYSLVPPLLKNPVPVPSLNILIPVPVPVPLPLLPSPVIYVLPHMHMLVHARMHGRPI